MTTLTLKYALDIPAILECVDKGYQIHPFFAKWEIKWSKNNQSVIGPTIRDALDGFKNKVVAQYVDPEIG